MDKEAKKHLYCPSDVGGEALIEGVMMRSSNTVASAVRKSDGKIVVEKRKYVPISKRNKFFGMPIIRGAIGIFESMLIGMKALMDSAEKVEIEEADPSNFERFLEKIFGDKFMNFMLYFSVLVAIILGIGIFILVPNWVISVFSFNKNTATGSLLANFMEGLLRVSIFFTYIIAISNFKDIRRVFEYHGAEHKTIYCYESGEELTVENASKHIRFHPRCGTAFLFVVMIVSILFFSFAGWHSKLINTLIRLALLPLIAGISYEVIKLAGKTDSKVVKFFTAPGLFLQRFTTKEPDKDQLEVAISALKAVVENVGEVEDGIGKKSS